MRSTASTAIRPARRVEGTLRVPGDKSISHRYALVAALADGRSRITNFAPGADCHSTIACLRGLGVEIRETSPRELSIEGPGLFGLREPHGRLDAGNSGSTMRMAAGILAGQRFTTTMIGDGSLSRRPMRRVMVPLGQMGARIDAVDGHAPLTIQGTALSAVAYRPDVPSAQVKSAVLLAGLHAEGTTTVTEPAQTRDHTERALAAFGFESRVDGLTVSVSAGRSVPGQSLDVPGDFSSAAFWMVAAAALPGSRVEIRDVGLNPTRTGLVDVLQRFGARVTIEPVGITAGEPRGTITVEGDLSSELDIDPDEVPILIDELPAIAALASRGGRVTVRGASELRVKESDRIRVLVAGFLALGIHAEEHPDGFTILGGGQPSGGVADAGGDHRMAMAFAVAALAGRGPSIIEGSDAVVISYPDFFDTLEQLAR